MPRSARGGRPDAYPFIHVEHRLCRAGGLAALLPRSTRRIGGGRLLGVLVSAVGFLLVLVVVVVGCFVIGGNELS